MLGEPWNGVSNPSTQNLVKACLPPTSANPTTRQSDELQTRWRRRNCGIGRVQTSRFELGLMIPRVLDFDALAFFGLKPEKLSRIGKSKIASKILLPDNICIQIFVRKCTDSHFGIPLCLWFPKTEAKFLSVHNGIKMGDLLYFATVLTSRPVRDSALILWAR